MSKFKEGDWAFSIRSGWAKISNVVSVDRCSDTVFVVLHADINYTKEGKNLTRDQYSSLFTIEEAAFHNFPPCPPRPKEKKKQKVYAICYEPYLNEGSNVMLSRNEECKKNYVRVPWLDGVVEVDA